MCRYNAKKNITYFDGNAIFLCIAVMKILLTSVIFIKECDIHLDEFSSRMDTKMFLKNR